MLTALRQNKKKVIQRVQKYSVVLKNLDGFIRPETKVPPGIARYLELLASDYWDLAELLQNINDNSPAELRIVFRLLRAFSKPLVTIDVPLS